MQIDPDIDIVLSDINMPKMDGLTLLAKLNDIAPSIKTVIVSAYGDLENIRKAMNGGAFDFLTKPIDFQDLEITINKTLQHVQQLKENLRLRQEQEFQLQQSEEKFRALAQREELINRIAKKIRNSLDLKTILNSGVNQIRKLLQVQRCQFLWYRSDVEHPYFEMMQEATASESVNIQKQSLLQEVAALGEIILKLKIFQTSDILTDCQLDEKSRNQLAALGLTSLLAVSIHTHTGRIGVVICSDYSKPHFWSDNDVELMQAVADQLAIAIDQAELYSQSRFAATKAQIQASQLQQALSDLKKAQSELIQVEKMSSLGQMVAGVAHEINNPVNFISGNIKHTSNYIKDVFDLLHLYQRHFPDPGSAISEKIEEIDLDFLMQDLPKALSSMEVGAVRISEIVLALRNFSRLDEAEMKPVDIHSGIDSTLLILQARLQAKPGRPSIEIIKEYGNLPLVECYAGQLNQVFMNILNNAIDTLEKQDSPRIITISTSVLQNSSGVLIKIADNGPGMTSEVNKRLFDPFFTTKTVGAGTGLGLSISYQIVVDKHGGKLKCNSAPGQGAEFLIEIPVNQPNQKS